MNTIQRSMGPPPYLEIYNPRTPRHVFKGNQGGIHDLWRANVGAPPDYIYPANLTYILARRGMPQRLAPW